MSLVIRRNHLIVYLFPHQRNHYCFLHNDFEITQAGKRPIKLFQKDREVVAERKATHAEQAVVRRNRSMEQAEQLVIKRNRFEEQAKKLVVNRNHFKEKV